MKRPAAIEVKDVLHVLVAVVEEELVLEARGIALITVGKGFHLTLALGKPTKARVWDLVGGWHSTFYLIKSDFKTKYCFYFTNPFLFVLSSCFDAGVANSAFLGKENQFCVNCYFVSSGLRFKFF